MAKCLEVLRNTVGQHSVIRNPVILCCISDISGRDTLEFQFWREISCEACQRWHGRDSEGQKQSFVSTGNLTK